MSQRVAAGTGPPEIPPRKAPTAGMVPGIESAACVQPETGLGLVQRMRERANLSRSPEWRTARNALDGLRVGTARSPPGVSGDRRGDTEQGHRRPDRPPVMQRGITGIESTAPLDSRRGKQDHTHSNNVQVLHYDYVIYCLNKCINLYILKRIFTANRSIFFDLLPYESVYFDISISPQHAWKHKAGLRQLYNKNRILRIG